MDELITEIESVYKMISSVSVSGDNIDLIAAARAKLRKIHTDLNNRQAKPESDSTEEV